MTVDVSPAIVAIPAGTTGTVTVDAQRMIDGPGDYTITATSDSQGVTAAPVSGQTSLFSCCTALRVVLSTNAFRQGISTGSWLAVIGVGDGSQVQAWDRVKV